MRLFESFSSLKEKLDGSGGKADLSQLFAKPWLMDNNNETDLSAREENGLEPNGQRSIEGHVYEVSIDNSYEGLKSQYPLRDMSSTVSGSVY